MPGLFRHDVREANHPLTADEQGDTYLMRRHKETTFYGRPRSSLLWHHAIVVLSRPESERSRPFPYSDTHRRARRPVKPADCAAACKQPNQVQITSSRETQRSLSCIRPVGPCRTSRRVHVSVVKFVDWCSKDITLSKSHRKFKLRIHPFRCH